MHRSGTSATAQLLALAGDLLGSGGLAVVMANQPPPASEVAVEGAGGPVRFRLTAEAAYAAAGRLPGLPEGTGLSTVGVAP